jgi:murein DD-endopeptidase MepM/ murein hydrolase activator NlpD
MSKTNQLIAKFQTLFTKEEYRIRAFSVFFISGILIGYMIPSLSSSDNMAKDNISENPADVIIAKIDEDPSPAKKTEEKLTETAPEKTTPREPALEIVEISLKSGGNLNDLLTSNGVSNKDAYLIQKAIGKHFNMRKLQIGQKFQLSIDESQVIQKIILEKDFDHLVVVQRTEKDGSYKYSGKTEEIPTEIITRHAKGQIQGSLFVAAQKQGIPQNIIAEMIRIFSFEVDFQREIRRGDGFELFYEREITLDGTKAREGNILFAQLTLRGKPLALYRFKPTDSKITDYFHLSGQSSKRMLMKTPVKGARLSGRYGPRKKHPVLGYSTMHKGVDFAAPRGTPIMAAGDGIIERSRRWSSFGNYVRIRHNKTYKTAYAHLSRYGKGIKEGRRVKQGQIIGYVGATGRVTGVHLHYEVHKNGVQINPLKLKIPTGRILGGKQKKLFVNACQKIDDAMTKSKRLASLNGISEGDNTLAATAPASGSE